MILSGRFGVRILAKSTVEVLPRPHFGQFQKGYSRKPTCSRSRTYTGSRAFGGLTQSITRRSPHTLLHARIDMHHRTGAERGCRGNPTPGGGYNVN